MPGRRTGMQRLVSGAAAGDQRDLARLQRLAGGRICDLRRRRRCRRARRRTSRLSSSNLPRRIEKFFHVFLPRLFAPPYLSLHERDQRRAVSRTISSNSRLSCSSPKSTTSSFSAAQARRRREWLSAVRMGVRVRVEKCPLVGRREVADLENDLEMRRRNRRGIARVRDLRDEASFSPSALASRYRVPEGPLSRTSPESSCTPRPGRPSPREASRRSSGGPRRSSRGDRSACARERRPATPKARAGPPPASAWTYLDRRGVAAQADLPPDAPPCARHPRSAALPPDARGSLSAATAPLSRAAAITYCVRSLEPIEKNAASKPSMAMRRGGHFDHDAKGRERAGRPLRPAGRATACRTFRPPASSSSEARSSAA